MHHHALVRHAHAGRRGDLDDHLRPLTERGVRQAIAIADRLAAERFIAVHSSPFVRCIQTVEPVAACLGMSVQVEARLGEGAGPGWLLDLLESAAGPVACCSHGDVLGDTLVALARRGVPMDDDRCQKGSIWTVTVDGGSIVGARYTPPGEDHSA